MNFLPPNDNFWIVIFSPQVLRIFLCIFNVFDFTQLLLDGQPGNEKSKKFRPCQSKAHYLIVFCYCITQPRSDHHFGIGTKWCHFQDYLSLALSFIISQRIQQIFLQSTFSQHLLNILVPKAPHRDPFVYQLLLWNHWVRFATLGWVGRLVGIDQKRVENSLLPLPVN